MRSSDNQELRASWVSAPMDQPSVAKAICSVAGGGVDCGLEAGEVQSNGCNEIKMGLILWKCKLTQDLHVNGLSYLVPLERRV